jgi:hypothetical protein
MGCSGDADAATIACLDFGTDRPLAACSMMRASADAVAGGSNMTRTEPVTVFARADFTPGNARSASATARAARSRLMIASHPNRSLPGTESWTTSGAAAAFRPSARGVVRMLARPERESKRAERADARDASAPFLARESRASEPFACFGQLALCFFTARFF